MISLGVIWVSPSLDDPRGVREQAGDWASRQAAAEELVVRSAEFERMLYRLSERCALLRFEEVRQAILNGWQRLGGEITDPELSMMANQIMEGSPMRLEVHESR